MAIACDHRLCDVTSPCVDVSVRFTTMHRLEATNESMREKVGSNYVCWLFRRHLSKQTESETTEAHVIIKNNPNVVSENTRLFVVTRHCRWQFHAGAGGRHGPHLVARPPNSAVLLTHCGQMILRKIS